MSDMKSFGMGLNGYGIPYQVGSRVRCDMCLLLLQNTNGNNITLRTVNYLRKFIFD